MYRKSLKLITFLTLFLSLMSNAFAEAIDSEEALAFASFIQDLVHKTQTNKQGVICATGSDEISKIISQNKAFIYLDNEQAKYHSCKAVYVAMGKEKIIRSDIDKFNKNKILTIAIFDGFTEAGGMVQVQMGRRNFELTLNSKIMKEASVRLSALDMNLVIN